VERRGYYEQLGCKYVNAASETTHVYLMYYKKAKQLAENLQMGCVLRVGS
jgi:hypothetical protein